MDCRRGRRQRTAHLWYMFGFICGHACAPDRLFKTPGFSSPMLDQGDGDGDGDGGSCDVCNVPYTSNLLVIVFHLGFSPFFCRGVNDRRVLYIPLTVTNSPHLLHSLRRLHCGTIILLLEGTPVFCIVEPCHNIRIT